MISFTAYRLAFWLLLIAVAILSMVSVPSQQLFEWQDKLHHMGAYAVLFLLLTRAYGQSCNLWILAVGLILFGLAIEIAQSFTVYRQADLWDIAANISGILIVGLILSRLKRN